uniref:Genome polyprotein n=1 Tax=Carrot necrotic dieback virus TaxID=680112 RepID=A0A8F2FBT3_9SECO|nr:polyprotein [Carrot necrotic dieback virus]
MSAPSKSTVRLVDGININDPTATALAAANGLWGDVENASTCMYNFFDVSDVERNPGESSKQLVTRIKKRASALLGVSRAHKDTEQVLSAERCQFKEFSEDEEIMATTFEPLKDRSEITPTAESKIDKTLESHRAKFNYMAVDSIRVAVTSLMHSGDSRECIMYLCDRRFKDPVLGAIALIGFTLPGMQTHVYKTGRMLAFSRKEAIAADRLQLFLYVKGAKLERNQNTPITVNVRTSLIFGSNAENLLKNEVQLDCESNLVDFMSQNQNLFGWLEAAQGGGYVPRTIRSATTHVSNSVLLDRWNNPTGSVSRRIASRAILAQAVDTQPEDGRETDVLGNDYSSKGLRIGRAQASIQNTFNDEKAYSLDNFVQDGPIVPVVANLESFMNGSSINKAMELISNQFTRPVYTDTFSWDSTDEVGSSIFQLELPGDVIGPQASSMYSDTMQRAFCFSNDFELNVLVTGNESYMGAIKVVVDQLRRFHEAKQDDARVFHSMPGKTILAKDSDGAKMTVEFMSIHKAVSAHDKNSHNALSRVECRVLAPLTHISLPSPSLSVTIQVFVKNVNANYMMWRSIETTFPMAQASLPSSVGDNFGRKRDSQDCFMNAGQIAGIITERAFLGTALITQETPARMEIAEFALHPMSCRNVDGTLLLSQLAALSAMFSFWRGSLIVTFEINSSASTRGKLVVSVTPKGGVALGSVTTAHHGYGAEFDLGTSSTRSFTMPFVSTDEWEAIGDEGIMSAFEDIWDCPVAHLIVLHPITSIAEITPSVDIRCYLEPGPDFQLRGRRHIGLRTSARPLSLAMAQSSQVLDKVDFSLMATVSIDATEESVIIAVPCAPWYSKEEVDYTLLQNPLHWASRMFTLWRGDLEFRFVIKEEALGDGWQNPISVWHNPNAELGKCKIATLSNKKISKETFYGKKISLAQLRSVEIEATDDRRFSWRLCKIFDTTKQETNSSATTVVDYTGHPPLSSQTGTICMKFPKNSVKAKVKIYSKPGSNFEFKHIGGVPSLQVSQMVKYKKPFQTSTINPVFVSPSDSKALKELGFKPKPTPILKEKSTLATGKAQGIRSALFNSISLWGDVDEESRELEKLVVSEGGSPLPIEESESWAKKKLTEIVSNISAKLVEAATSILSNAATRAISNLFDSMLGKVKSVLQGLIDGISSAFKQCLSDPKCMCIIGISISAVMGFSTLKFIENVVPDSLGIFKALMMVSITSISAIYWPQAAISIVSQYEKQFGDIENYCKTIYQHIFLGSTETGTNSATPAEASAIVSEDLAIGKAQAGGRPYLELAGLLAYIKLCVSLCKAMNVSFMEPFSTSNLEKQCRSISGISMGVKTLSDFKDYIYRLIVGGITPTSSYVKISAVVGFDIREWFEEVERMTLQETRYTQMGSEEKIKEVRTLYDKGVDVMGKLTMVDSPHLSRVCERSYKLCKELLDETHRCKGASSVRVDPFHVSLYGAPGVGKSFIMGKLLNDVLDILGEPKADRCYSKTPNEEYWSGYIGQTAIKCDDLGQDLSKGFSPTYNQIIQMKTNNCFIVPMADLANKGRTFTSKYIFSTTNVPGCGTKHGLADPGAFMRRRNLFVKVETEGEMVAGSVRHMRFTLLNPLNPDERVMKYPARMSYVDFLCVCVAEARVYLQTQEIVLKTLSESEKDPQEPTSDIVDILQEFGGGIIGDILEKRKEMLLECGVIDPPPPCDLADGKAQGSLAFSTDAFGEPMKPPFVGIFGELRDQFSKATKTAMSDKLLTTFGVNLVSGDLGVFGFEDQYGLNQHSDNLVMHSFFNFIFSKGVLYKSEDDFLKHLDTLTRMQVNRLVNEVQVNIVNDKRVLHFSNDYDREAFAELCMSGRLVFHLVLAVRAARKGKIQTLREKWFQWFETARTLSSNILEELPSVIKMMLVLATSVGSLYLAFKGLSGIGSAILGLFCKNVTKEEDYEIISLSTLMGQARRGRNFITSGDELTTRLSRVMSRAALATGRAQGGRRPADTCEILSSRQGSIMNMATGLHMVATDIGGGFLMCPLHIFAGAEKDDIYKFHNGADYYFAFDPSDVAQLSEYDACVIQTHSIPMRSSITNIFSNENQLDMLVDMDSHFVCGPWKLPGDGGYISEVTTARRVASFKYFMDDKLYMMVNGWSSPFKTEEGQCGSCMVSLSEKLDGKVFCMLVAGTYDNLTGQYVSTYVPVTVNMMRKAISGITTLQAGDCQGTICDSPVSEVVFSTLKMDELFSSTPTPSGNLGVFKPNDRMGLIEVVGRTFPNTTPKAICRSTIIPSLIQRFMPRKPLTEPAVLSPLDGRLGECRYDPMIDGIKKYQDQAKPIRGNWRKRIIDSMREQMEDWETFMVRENYDTLDLPMHTIINGISGIEYYEPLNMSTSEGYPLILSRPSDAHGKEYLFEICEDGSRAIKSAKLNANYEAYGSSLSSGEPFPLISIECPKDERRALDKIYDKPKTRLFSILPVEFNMHARRLFLDFNVFVMANRHKHGIMVGINPHSREWSDLAISLASFSPYGFNGDFANFDGMFHPTSFDMVAELANIFYGGFQSDERTSLTKALTNRFSLVKGGVLRISGGGPSGFPMTVIFNSFINLFYLQSAWIMLASQNGRSDISCPSNFPSFVRACVYGDDNIVAIKNEVLPWYNLQTVSKILKDYFGVTMTDGAKNCAENAQPYGKILDFDFLKRNFRPDELIPSLFHAPLHKRSIEEQVYWIREGGDSLALLEANIENAMYEAHHHGREYYNELKQQVKEAMHKAGYTNFVAPTFLMCRQRWLHQDLGEVSTSSLPAHVGLLKEAFKNNLTTELDECDIFAHFEEIQNANGGITRHGPLQKIMPGVFIGPTGVFERRFGIGLFNLVCDNSLSRGQTRYGVKHGIMSLQKPDFSYISDSLPSIMCESFKIICLDPVGGELAISTALCLAHAAGIIRTNAFCRSMRLYVNQWKHVLQAYFRIKDTHVGKEWEVCSRDIPKINIGCSRTTAVGSKYLTIDGQLPLEIKALANLQTVKVARHIAYFDDEEDIIVD